MSFLEILLSTLYFVFEVMALLVALWRFPQMRYTRYRYFVPFLIYVVAYEYGNMQNWFSVNHTNLYITNISVFVFFMFNSLFLVGLLKTPRYKKLAKIAIGLSIPLSAINMAFFQGFWRLDTATILLQFFIIVVLSALYFYELLHYTVTSLALIKLPGFWLSTGLFLYCLLDFLAYSSFAYMAYNNDYSYFVMFAGISNVSIAILYTCLAICFMCVKKPQTTPIT